jgi:hypothetical protein
MTGGGQWRWRVETGDVEQVRVQVRGLTGACIRAPLECSGRCALGLGPFQAGMGSPNKRSGLVLPHGSNNTGGPAQLTIQKIFQINSKAPTLKIQNTVFIMTKSSKLHRVIDEFKRNHFPFVKKFKFPIEFELKIQEAKQS